MINRRRILAIVLFIAAGLVVYTFANPANNNDGTNTQDEAQQLLDDATKAVEKAEDSKLQEDVDAARELVDQLPDGDDKDELNDRLDAIDTEAPVITVVGTNPITVGYGTTYLDAGATAIDNKDGNITAKIVTTGTVNTGVIGNYTITYNVTDEAGHSDTATRTVYVRDLTAPIITVNGASNSDLEVKTAYVELGATAIDNVDGNISGDIIVSGSVDYNTVGSYNLIYTVSDAAGNLNTATRTINVVDTTVPTLSLNGNSSIKVVLGYTTYTDEGSIFTDNYDATKTIYGIVDGDATQVGSYLLRYNGKDANGNNATEITRTVYVLDPDADEDGDNYSNGEEVDAETDYTDPKSYPDYDYAPTITLEGDATIYLEYKEAFVEPGYSALDVYDGDLTKEVEVTTDLDINKLGTYTIHYNVSDSTGNEANEASRTVIVRDTTAPTITLNGENPTKIVLKLTKSLLRDFNFYTDEGAVVTDNFDATKTIYGKVRNFDLDEDRIYYELHYNYTDSNSNKAKEVIREVYILSPYSDEDGDGYTNGEEVDAGTDYDDNESYPDYNAAPTISLKGDSTVYVEVKKHYNDLGATATDVADGNISYKIKRTGYVNTDVIGTYTLYYNVSDSLGNKATEVTRTVIVRDTTAPTIKLYYGSNPYTFQAGGIFDYSKFTASDNYDGNITSRVVVSGTVYEDTIGTYYVTFTVTDSSGNTTSKTLTVNVVDTIKPVITLHGLATVKAVLGYTTYTDEGAVVTDNFDADREITGIVSGNTNAIGSYQIKYNAIDSNTNLANEVIRTVYVLDPNADEDKDGYTNKEEVLAGTDFNDKNSMPVDLKPTVTVNPDTVTIDKGQTYNVMTGVSVTDDYHEGLTATASITNTASLNAGTYTITYTATDFRGNVGTATRTLIVNQPVVVDTTGPTVTFEYDNLGNGSDHHEVKVIVSDPSGVSNHNDELEYYWTTSDSMTHPLDAMFMSDFNNNDKIYRNQPNLPGNGFITYYLWIKATDTLGNVSYTRSNAVTFHY